MPARRKPTSLKRLEGTFRADRDHGEVAMPKPESTDPPEGLVSPVAVAYWEKLTRILIPNRVLSDADLEALLHLCNMHARCVRLWEAGEAPKAAELTQLRLMMAEFGLTPASRSRPMPLGSADPESEADEFFDGPAVVNG